MNRARTKKGDLRSDPRGGGNRAKIAPHPDATRSLADHDSRSGAAGHDLPSGPAQLRDVRASGPAWFGERVRIGAAVSVGVGAKVGAKAMLNRVAVLDGAVVEPGVLIGDSLVAPGGLIVPS